jgi:D-lactate dehydrogenase
VSNKSAQASEFLSKLSSIVGADQVLTEVSECWSYGYDNSRRHALPEAVVFPSSHQQVRDIVLLCNEESVPVTARGRGTGTTGATVPVQGGIVLSTERFDQTLEIDRDNRVAVVSPGITNKALQDKAGEYGFFWPPDPTSSAYCTVGGNLAYNSAGPRAVKYGTPRENVLGLQAVTGLGEELRTGTYTTKGVVGYDFTRLLVGSEGTLAIITEATLKLTPKPEAVQTMRAIYNSMESAAHAVSAIMAQPVTPCALEFIDGAAIQMIRDYSEVDLPANAGALLMLEVDGKQDELASYAGAIKTAATNDGLTEFTVAETEAAKAALWKTRKALSPALRKVAPKKINEDVVVPVSNIPKLIMGLEQLAKQHDITIVNFGHAGNGNIHVNLLTDPSEESNRVRAEQCLADVFSLVLDLKGTISGEHGVGLEKQAFVARELDPVSLRLMNEIKGIFDPNNILNPGKMFPARDAL